MNVYDFDGTIFYPNVTLKFAVWSIRKHPDLLITYFPSLLLSAAAYKLGKIPTHRFIRRFFAFLPRIKNFDQEIERFWDKNEKNISSWYLAQKKRDDLIISGSPECIVKPITDRLGVNLRATLYDQEMGVFYGNLMLAQSKSRYVIDLGLPVIDNFYSDSLSDTPIALCAERAFLVTKRARKPIPWPTMTRKSYKKIKKKIDIGWKHIED